MLINSMKSKNKEIILVLFYYIILNVSLRSSNMLGLTLPNDYLTTTIVVVIIWQ